VALVDGNNHQIDRIEKEAQARGVTVTVVVDFIHVLEYLWGAAWCFFTEGDTAAEKWVRAKALAVLEGNAGQVAAGIRRRASTARLARPGRKKADEAARYLVNKAAYLDYPTALRAGWPIATGVIEGACRYLVADRMDITGARWSVEGAEAVLKLRAIRANDHFDEYWRFHLNRERQRVHQSRYDQGAIPIAA
ncbi:MAG: ISKra4 family transposase, partial [Pseudonocardiaceae bacterium]